MFKLTNNPILLPHHVRILELFFNTPFGKKFFLTGGTALAAFYLGHRTSKDFDFFSMEPFDRETMHHVLRDIAQMTGASLSLKVESLTYNEAYLTHPSGWVQRIDLVQEQPKRFGEVVMVDEIRVDALENIGSNKVLTVFGRVDPKDYVDLYLIATRTPWEFDQLFEMAKQKDLGLSEFYFVDSISRISSITTWPEMKIPLDVPDLVRFYENLSRELLLRIKPKE